MLRNAIKLFKPVMWNNASWGKRAAYGAVAAGMTYGAYSMFSKSKESPMGAGIGMAIGTAGVLGGLKMGASGMARGLKTSLKSLDKKKSQIRRLIMEQKKSNLNLSSMGIHSPAGQRKLDIFEKSMKKLNSRRLPMANQLKDFRTFGKGINMKGVAHAAGFIGGSMAMTGMGRRYSGV